MLRPVNYVTGNDLHAWADGLDAAAGLPRLVYFLVCGSLTDPAALKEVAFPSGEGIRARGWDGRVVVTQGNSKVPDGMSGWELSTNQDPWTNATKNYDNRTREPLGLPPKETTFVYVTSRRWPSKEKWRREKEQDGKWKAVRAYDAEDLQQWLDLVPAVHDWFAPSVGKHPTGELDLNTFWRKWSGITNPVLSPELLTSGRLHAVERLMAWLTGPASVLTVASDSSEESVAFAAAAIQSLSEPERDLYATHALLVSDPSVIAKHPTATRPLYVFLEYPDSAVVNDVVARGFHAFVATGREGPVPKSAVVLNRISRDGAREQLKQLGLSDFKAQELSALARRSLLSLRRELSTIPEVKRPAWAQPENAAAVIPALLVGSWNGSDEHDCKYLADLAGKEYEQLERELRPLSLIDDPPLRRVGDTWYVVSRRDAWQLVSPYITEGDMTRFREVAQNLLGAVNPKYTLPAEKRWSAAIYGKVPRGTERIRDGVADTLAMMGALGGEVPIARGKCAADWAVAITRDLLTSDDWTLWASLSLHLRELAEAAPDAFLGAVEAKSAGTDPVIARLFTDAKSRSSFLGSSPHTGLLWALELLAWEPRYFSRAALALARLAELDPDGTYANRPRESLREIFLPWRPQTAADLSAQLAVLDLMRARHPDAAWSLMGNMLPKAHDNSHPTATPAWREWVPDQSPPSHREQSTPLVLQRMIDDAGIDGARWAELASAIGSLHQPHRLTLTTALEGLNAANLSAGSRVQIGNALREVIWNHRAFSTERWALPVEEVNQLEGIYHQVGPADSLARFAHLFDPYPRLLTGTRFSADDRAVDEARSQAIQHLWSEGGVQRLRAFAEHLERPAILGQAIGHSLHVPERAQRQLLEDIVSRKPKFRECGQGLLTSLAHRMGSEWLRTEISRTRKPWSTAAQVTLALALPDSVETWAFVDGLGAKAVGQFWKRWGARVLSDRANCEVAARKLLEHNMSHGAVSVLGFYLADSSHEVDAELVAQVLDGGLTAHPRRDRRALEPFHLTALLKYLASRSFDPLRLARLEFAYLSLRREGGWEPETLYAYLRTDPQWFADVVKQVYRSTKGEPIKKLSKQQEAVAHAAWELLDAWDGLPGSGDDPFGGPAPTLREWVERARELLTESGHTAIGDELIGKVLSSSNVGEDGIWPNEKVREIVELVQSSHVDTGIEVGLYNSRGTYGKSFYEGGEQERSLSETYQHFAEGLQTKWPRTASILRQVAETYASEARKADDDATLREDLG